MTVHWTLIFISAMANVCLNLSLRLLGRSLDTTSFASAFVTLALSPWAWLSVLSGIILLGTFVAAVRIYPLSLTYIGVTAVAMVVLTVLGVAFRYETVSLARVAGLTMIVAGLILSARG